MMGCCNCNFRKTPPLQIDIYLCPPNNALFLKKKQRCARLPVSRIWWSNLWVAERSSCAAVYDHLEFFTARDINVAFTRFVPVRCYGSWIFFNAVGNIKRFLTNFTKIWIRWTTNKSQTIHILQRITFQWPKIKKRQSNRANIIKSHLFDINDEYKSIFHHFFLLYWKRNWEKLKPS